MAKDKRSLQWIEDLLPKEFSRKPMFGGFAYYVERRMVLALFEKTGDREHRGQKFPFEVWNGCMFPVEHENHQKVRSQFPELISHPVLPKWFYLPAETEDFETHVEEVMRQIRRQSALFGVIPKLKKKGKTPKSKETPPSKIDTRTPSMFRDEPIATRLVRAKKISDLKNLGPASEKSFQKAGIKSVSQFVKMGWKKAMIKLVDSNPKHRHSLYAYAVIGALTNCEWNGISAEEKEEAKKFMASLKPPKKQKEKSPRGKKK